MLNTHTRWIFASCMAVLSSPAAAQLLALRPRPVAGYEIVVAETPADTTASKQLQADCPAGKAALGAGWSVLDPSDAILEGAATYSEPAWDGRSWLTNAKNLSAYAAEWKLRVRLVCAEAVP
jgi:hypothetical protein